ncbi:MAG: TonB-dependent receptor [Acidobacteriales bacterium]|nr:TonB-dependent receptor [Terriglobales bacterium]
MCVQLTAQTTTATLEGVVTDSSQALVPGAKVELTNEGTNIKQVRMSDPRGRYFFPLLPPGSYRLNVTLAGFQTFQRTGVVLQVQQAARVDVALQMGEVTTKVEVTGEAPRLDAVNATQGRVFSNSALLDMPGAQNPLGLAVMTPGVVGLGGYPTGGGVNFSANGGRLSVTDVTLDGVTTSVMEHNSGIQQIQYTPTNEAVQEFKIQTNGYSAEYGTSGNVVISMVSKSGTNELHGDVFDYYNNSAFSANNFFNNRNGRPVAKSHSNQYGFAVGGPTYIPKIYDGRNKTFFFFHYERRAVPTTLKTWQGTVPTELEKNGDFSQTMTANGQPVTIYDPTTVYKDDSGSWARLPFAGNKVPKGMWSSVAAKVLPYYPNPTSNGSGPSHVGNFFVQNDYVQSWYQMDAKVDHNFTENQRLSVRYSRNPTSSYDASDPWGEGNFMVPNNYSINSQKPQNAVANYTNILNPTTVLTLQWGVTRNYAYWDHQDVPTSFIPSSLGFKGEMQIQQPPSFQMQGYTNIGPNMFDRSIKGADVNHLQASLTKTQGAHSLKLGGEARFYRLNYGQPGISTAQFAFCSQQTAASPLAGAAAQGSSLASFMVGFGGSCGSSYQNIDLTSMAASRVYGGYVQDDYRVTPKLTVNLGLRYEVQLPATERHDRFQYVDLSITNPLAGKLPFTDNCPACSNLKGGYVYNNANNRSPYNTMWADFAPRVGFAYQFAPRSVIRGGYGWFYGPSNGGLVGFLADGYVTSTSFIPSSDGGIHMTNSIDNPFPNGINQPVGSSQGSSYGLGTGIGSTNMKGMGGIDLNTTPRTQQWGLSVERELPFNSVFELAYSATKGTHLGFGTLRSFLSYVDPTYEKLGAKLWDQVANPFYGLVPATADLNTRTVMRRQLLSAYPQYSLVSMRPGPPRANSIYHAMIAKFTKHLSSGLQMTTSYTFSKSISDSDSADDPNVDWLTGNIGENGGGRARIQDSSNLRLERSVSQFDIPHRFLVDFSYKLPVGRGQAFGSHWGRALDIIAGGWQINGVLQANSGTPLVPHLSGGTVAESGLGNVQRPNVIGDPNTSGSTVERLNRYLDPAAFSVPQPFVNGTAPRVMGYARAPGFHGMDASIFKQFHLTENRYGEFRWEAYNVTNTPIFGVPGTTVGAGNFGVISSQANGPRSMRMVLKFYF